MPGRICFSDHQQLCKSCDPDCVTVRFVFVSDVYIVLPFKLKTSSKFAACVGRLQAVVQTSFLNFFFFSRSTVTNKTHTHITITDEACTECYYHNTKHTPITVTIENLYACPYHSTKHVTYHRNSKAYRDSTRLHPELRLLYSLQNVSRTVATLHCRKASGGEDAELRMQ